MLTIRPATGATDLADVRALFAEYAAWLGVDLSYQRFAEELASLPGAYVPPAGALLLAVDGERVFGCVAMRALDRETAEMKRLFVRPAGRGTGAGRALVAAVLAAARACGYRRMRLDTMERMQAAIALYRSLGFREIAAYYPSPVAETHYFEIDLASDPSAESKGSR
jgi:ribosomal protein S18 acetylase RimI-like enzyme